MWSLDRWFIIWDFCLSKYWIFCHYSFRYLESYVYISLPCIFLVILNCRVGNSYIYIYKVSNLLIRYFQTVMITTEYTVYYILRLNVFMFQLPIQTGYMLKHDCFFTSIKLEHILMCFLKYEFITWINEWKIHTRFYLEKLTQKHGQKRLKLKRISADPREDRNMFDITFKEAGHNYDKIYFGSLATKKPHFNPRNYFYSEPTIYIGIERKFYPKKFYQRKFYRA